MPGELKTILDRIRKPLAFAGRDNFAHLKSLTALEPFMRAQVADLKRITEGRPESSEIEDLFSGFDSLDPEKKKDRILKASEVIDALERSQEPSVSQSLLRASFATTQPSEHPLRLDTPVQYCKGVGPKRSEMLAKL